MRRPIIGGNWKMNTTLESAVDLAEELARRIVDPGGVDVVLFPPFPNLGAVYRVIEGGPLQLGAQDVFWEQQGAFTGEVSAPMLAAVGCDWVIVGHSERRRILGESNEVVNLKVHAALHGGLSIILAVGETREERHAGSTEQVLHEQLHHSLAAISSDVLDRIVIAYEPVWAIGTGEVATPDDVQETAAAIRARVSEFHGAETAASVRILYGGSVKPGNIAPIMAQPDVDGALVGGASLDAGQFAQICRYRELAA